MDFRVPLIIRGTLIDETDAEHGGRRGSVAFRTADVARHVDRLPLSRPSALGDLYDLRFDDIVDFLAKLGPRLDPARNIWLKEAFELSCRTSGLSESIIRDQYAMIPAMFDPAVVRDIADRLIGIPYLEGWVKQPQGHNPLTQLRIRAIGARAVHIIAGNVPVVGVATVIRNAITRSDAIIKTPSNDPLTAAAVVRTMIEMDPDHPISRHVSVAYWKGGDSRVEDALYDPRRIEKIVAWGGFAGIRHLTRYLQPGIDLITLDPKHSSTIIGAEAFADEAVLAQVARRLALDIGTFNQEGCVNARVIYVQSGTGPEGLERANRLGQATFEAMQQLPARLSTPHGAFDPELRAEMEALAFMADEYRMIGGRGNEGAIIVSQSSWPVDFARALSCRVANIVPVDDLDTAVLSVNSYTQTIGIFPDDLKDRLRDRLAYQGAQRLVSLGGAAMHQDPAPQDGIEPLRRMVKWITDETMDGAWLAQMAGEDAQPVG